MLVYRERIMSGEGIRDPSGQGDLRYDESAYGYGFTVLKAADHIFDDTFATLEP